jgi:acyl-coenzyme A thioesterase PaaI-like protein
MSQEAFSTADAQGYFSRMLRGETPPAPVLTLLGSRISAVDAAAGRLSARYEAQVNFRNPAGTVQGGMLSAMTRHMFSSHQTHIPFQENAR